MVGRTSALIPIEKAILRAALGLEASGDGEFHGFLIAKEVGDLNKARMLVGHGTLYKALGRLHASGLLTSRWEDDAVAAEARRPRRRLYKLTALGERAARTSTAQIQTGYAAMRGPALA